MKKGGKEEKDSKSKNIQADQATVVDRHSSLLISKHAASLISTSHVSSSLVCPPPLTGIGISYITKHMLCNMLCSKKNNQVNNTYM